LTPALGQAESSKRLKNMSAISNQLILLTPALGQAESSKRLKNMSAISNQFALTHAAPRKGWRGKKANPDQ
jgi:hypothetical protein